MTAVAFPERVRTEGRPGGLPAEARGFLAVTLAAAAVAAAATALAATGDVRWRDVAVVLAGGAVAQFFATHTAGNQVFHTGLAFTVVAALLLPPQLVVLVVVAQHLPEWLRQRYPWFIAAFNTANVILSALAAWALSRALAGAGIDVLRDGAAGIAAAAAVGAVFVVTNHLLLARMLFLARGHDLRASGLFTLDGLTSDGGLVAIGVAIAFGLVHEPAFVLVAVAPLILIQRALAIPTLRDQAFRDHKTGLLNSRGIDQKARDEFARARRSGRRLTILLCDVDGLREINNRHGHLVGDAALLTIGDAFRAELRRYDLCARFGGDEFLVVLPETSEEEALAVAARIVERLAAQPVAAEGGPVRVTVSIGAAVSGVGDALLGDLVARADAAMYEAKHAGRRGFIAVA